MTTKSGEIFLIKDDGQLVGMKQSGYESENLLQEFLQKYPNLLAGDQIDSVSPRRWLLVSREAGVPADEEGGDRWSLDHLFLDQDGIPTLVEVKRSSDTRIRREVVGQMLDYAANAVANWSVEKIRAKLAARCGQELKSVEEVLEKFLGTEGNMDEFWETVKTNLQAGRIRLLFVADEIPSELRRIVEFLNKQMDPAQVLAIEICQFTGEGLKTLVPRVYGQTEEAQQKKSGGIRETRQWDESSFLDELLNSGGKEIAEIGQKILEWSKEHMTRIWWGKGVKDGSFIPVLDYNGRDYFAFAVRTGFRNPHIQLQFGPLASRPPFDGEIKRRELMARLKKIPGSNLPEDAIDRYPSIRLEVFRDVGALNTFLEAMNWFIQEIKAS